MNSIFSLVPWYQKPFEYQAFAELPFIASQSIAGDVEELLHHERSNSEFTLKLNLLSRHPKNLDEYVEHEHSVLPLFQRIAERRYPLSMVVSAANHYSMHESGRYQWADFFDRVIILDRETYYSYHGVYQRFDFRSLRVVLDSGSFKYLRDDIEGGYFEHECFTRETPSGQIPGYSIRIPVGSVIQVTLGPEPYCP